MTLRVEVYYSVRSPYCYLLTGRLVELAESWDAEVRIRPVYPIAVRDPGFFKRIDPLYRPYHLRDSARLAATLGIAYRRPVPDPIVQDLASGAIADEQPHIRRLTRLTMAAAQAGHGLAYVDQVMTLLWDGRTDGWHTGDHLARAAARAGLDPAVLHGEDEALDRAIEANQRAQRAAGHWGVPLMVFDGEPFYGQDRFATLMWRMKQAGLQPRP